MRTSMQAVLGAAALTLLVVAAGACSKPETRTEPNPEVAAIIDASTGAVVIADAAPPSTAATAAIEPEDTMPTHAEEDIQAAQEIQKSNYKQELDRLAKEIESP